MAVKRHTRDRWQRADELRQARHLERELRFMRRFWMAIAALAVIIGMGSIWS
jgi:hypothetical protein